MRRLPTAVLAAASLVLGFTAAQLTGLRWAGAVVVVAGAAWCVVRERRRTAAWRLLVVVLVGAAAFALSHVLADPLGAWAAVAVAAGALGAVTWGLVDRRPVDHGAPARPEQADAGPGGDRLSRA